MKNNISIEYAEAMLLLGKEESRDEEILKDLRLIKSAICKNGEFIELLHSPNISKEEKCAIIDTVFEGRVCEYAVSLLKLLCENNRIELLPLCIEDYEKLYSQINKVVSATVISAVELTEEEKAKIVKSLEKKTKNKVELECQIDKSILGGIVIKTEDAIMDGSLKRKIRDVKEVIGSESKA